MKLQPFADRWGPDAPLQMLAQSAVCKICGHRGGRTIIPSMKDANGGPEPFPEDR